MSEFKEKTYRLVGDSYLLSYLLKTGRNKKLIVFDNSDKSPAKHRNRAIRYCFNESSIFLDEQTDNAVSRAIVFQNQLLETKPTDTVLQRFLAVHPDNVANGGSVFEELDAEKEAKNELQYEEMVLDIKSAVRKKEKEKDGIDELEALAAVLVGSVAAVKEMSASELKREIYSRIDSNPSRFVDDKGNVTIFEDSSITRKYIVLKAINHGVILVSSDNRSIQWGDKGVITNVPIGINPVEHFATFLESDEGLLILDEIQKRF